MSRANYDPDDFIGARSIEKKGARHRAPSFSIAAVVSQIGAAKDYTVVAVNKLGQVQLVAFADDNTLPAGALAKLRFANAMVDSGTVDVLVNFASQASAFSLERPSWFDYRLAS